MTIICLCAMEEEACHLREAISRTYEMWGCPCEDKPIKGVARRTVFPELHLEVIITNVGTAHAAMACTAVLLEPRPEPVRAVISCGCSGAHHASFNPGDVVVGTAIASPGQCKEKLGEVEFEGFRLGFNSTLGATLPCDPFLVEAAMQAAAEAGLREANSSVDPSACKPVTLPRWPGAQAPPAVIKGVVASDDAWCCEPINIARCRQAFHSVCEEMEAGAVAVVCKTFGVPFVAIKDISNNELTMPQPGLAAEEPLLVHEIGKRAALLTMALILKLKDEAVR